MCEILKKLGAVGVAVRCRPSRGCFATPALIPASKIGGISTPILKKVILRKSCQNRPKSRSNPACRVFSPTFSAKPQHGPKFWLTGGTYAKEKDRRMLLLRSSPHIYFLFHFHRPIGLSLRLYRNDSKILVQSLFFQTGNHLSKQI